MTASPETTGYDQDDEEPDYELTKDQVRAMSNLTSDATHVALGGGSRSGKTFLFCRAMCLRASKAPGSRHVIFRFRFNSAKTAIAMDTMPKVIKLCFPHWPTANSMLDKTDWFFTLPNDSQIWISGLDDKDRVEKVLGHEYVTMFFNECSQIPYNSVETALTRLAMKTDTLKLKAYYDLNPPSKKHWTYRLLVEKRDPHTNHPVVNEFNYNYMQMNPEGNIANLDPDYIKHLEGLGEAARKRFLHGLFSEDDEGALWPEELLTQQRLMGQEGELPPWLRVVIAVDPSGSKGAEDFRSNEIGIVVGAVGTDGKGYLLADLTGRYKPEEWGTVVCDAFERYKADMVVAEVNFGGDMVRATIQAVNPNIPFTAVTASRGKIVRAEPISALYEQGKIFHVGHFPELEDQMTAMLVSGYQGLLSPDRADALVWLFTYLFPKLTRKTQQAIAPPRTITQPRTAKAHSQIGQPRVNRSNRSMRRRI